MTVAADHSVPRPKRDLLPDLVRAWALIGIVLVNVEMFSSPILNGYGAEGLSHAADHWSYWVVNALFTLKSYSLFSLMFGAGLGYQIEAAKCAGHSLSGRYFRRISGLLLIGSLHAIFLFVGDILVTYALLGVLLYFCRNGQNKTLLYWGIGLISFQILILLIGAAGLRLISPDSAQIVTPDQQKVFDAYDLAFANGSYLASAKARLSVLPGLLPNILTLQGISAFGFFLIGFSMFRSGLIRDPGHRFWAIACYVLLPTGLMISIWGAFIYTNATDRQTASALAGMGIMMIGSPFTNFGYLGWLATLCKKQPGRMLTFFARGGSASLSAYLVQSVILSFVYAEYGLGLFGKLSASVNILIALMTGFGSLGLLSLWRLFFHRGPAEIILRKWIYIGQTDRKV